MPTPIINSYANNKLTIAGLLTLCICVIKSFVARITTVLKPGAAASTATEFAVSVGGAVWA